MALVKPKITTQPAKASASRMLADFSNKQTFFWFLVAFAIHVAIIGATSVGYIKNGFAEAPPATQPVEPAPQATTPDGTPVVDASKSTPPTNTQSTGTADEKALLEERKDSPMVKELNEVAKPEDIPKGTSRDGIGLDESLDGVR